eukprot:6300013-Alexandrium_andersonii.AAC.1
MSASLVGSEMCIRDRQETTQDQEGGCEELGRGARVSRMRSSKQEWAAQGIRGGVQGQDGRQDAGERGREDGQACQE